MQTNQRRSAPGVLTVLALCALLAASCGPGDVVEIEDSRTASRPSHRVRLGVTSAQRFEPSVETPPPPSSPFAYDVPPGWGELETTEYRLANLALHADPKVQCWVSVLPGNGGGTLDNVSRWHVQMSIPPPTEEEVAALEQRVLLGRPAVYVMIDGDYTTLEGTPRENWRMLVLFASVANNTVYVKMVGPVDVIEEEAGRFEAFCDTLRLRMDVGPDPPVEEEPNVVLGWDAPDSWRVVSRTSTRLLNFELGTDSECYVSIFGGRVLDNANRWRGQVGLPPLEPGEFDALERVSIMGIPSVLVEGTGPYKGMRDPVAKPNTTLLGTITEMGQGRVLFILMVGPADEVAAERDDFLVFAQSLRSERR